tara:strand:+ start:4753 stop:5274 length:522 start_codon:yes stop_codon:yes gene_type:complete
MIKTNKKVGYDVDGVLAGFYPDVCRRQGRSVETVDFWHIPWIEEMFHEIADRNEPRFWENMSVLNPPHTITVKPDCYISHLPQCLQDEREEWLFQNEFPHAPLILAEDKIPHILERGLDLFIDDKPATIHALFEAGIPCLQYVPYYASDKIIDDYAFQTGRYIRNLADVKNFL